MKTETQEFFERFVQALSREEKLAFYKILNGQLDDKVISVPKAEGMLSASSQLELGLVLKKLREDRGLTVYAAAKRANIRPVQVRTLEGSDEKFDNYTAQVLFNYLNSLEFKFYVSK